MADPTPMGASAPARRMAAVAALVAALALSAGGPPPIAATQAPAVSPRPNILVILVDDLGWADTAPYGSAFHETPAIDRLAREGVRFAQFYSASPVCSPTRASLMTGKYPSRLHITDWIGGNDTGPLLPPAYEHALPLEELTIAEAFRDAGYVTGYLGKWHLGDGPFMPGAQGFAFTRAVNRAGQPATYFFPYQGPKPSQWSVPDLEGGSPGEYLTDRLTDEAVAFVRAHKDEPFMLVLSHYAVHTPLEAPTPLTAKYEARARALPGGTDGGVRPEGAGAFTKTRQDHPTYAAMVERTDASVGRLIDEIDGLGLSPRTVVVFAADNGGLSTLTRRTGAPTSNSPLRAGKGWLYEGGIRVPLIVRWSGRLPAGRVVDRPGITTDLFPTLLGLAGLPARPSQHVDGVNLGPALTGSGREQPREALFWDFPHYHGSGHTPSSAVRSGDLKLIEWYEDHRAELYDLAADPYETHDLAAARRADADRLRRQLQDWRASVGARAPTKNPAWKEKP